MIKNILYILFGLILLLSCDKDNEKEISPLTCENDNSLNVITQRNFEMGFSTWSFGPDETDKKETYQFIKDTILKSV